MSQGLILLAERFVLEVSVLIQGSGAGTFSMWLLSCVCVVTWACLGWTLSPCLENPQEAAGAPSNTENKTLCCFELSAAFWTKRLLEIPLNFNGSVIH